MAVVDEASVRITPDTSGFAEELRAEVEAAIDEATAGLDKTVKIKVDVDTQDAAAKMRQAINDFTNDGRTGFAQMKADEQALFDDIGANAERSRIKQTTEQTKLRDKLKAVWEPAIVKLKKDQKDEETGWKKVEAATVKAATAAGKVSPPVQASAAAEERFAKALEDVDKAANKVEASVQRSIAAQARKSAADAAAAKAEKLLVDARNAVADAATRVEAAEQKLSAVRAKDVPTAKELQAAEREVAAARQFSEIATTAAEREEANFNAARGKAAAAAATAIDAEQRVSATRKASEKATADAKKVEEDLSTARIAGVNGTKAFTAVEKELFAGRKEGVNGTRAFASAEEALRVSENAVKDAHVQHIGVLGQLRNAFAKAGDSTTKLGTKLHEAGKEMDGAGIFAGLLKTGVTAAGSAIQGFGTFVKAASTTTEGLSGVMQALGGSVMDTVGSLGEGEKGLLNFAKALVQLGAQSMTYLTIGAAVADVIGAIVAAVAGLPALLSAAGASFAVIELGMKGIQAAYKSALKPALDDLKKQVSEVFENGLKPEFRDLATKLIPAVTAPLKQLAGAFVEVTGRIVTTITTGKGLEDIKGIINKTTDAIRALGQPLADAIAAFLRLANTGTILQNMVGIVQDLVTNVGDWLAELSNTGAAEAAVQQLRDALNEIEKVVLNVATSFMNFFTQVQPGITDLIQGIGQVASALLDRLGPAFRQVFTAIGDALKKISPQVWDQLRDAVQRVADKLTELSNNGQLTAFFETLIRLVTMGIDAFGRVVGAIQKVSDALHALNSALAPVNQAAEKILGPLGLWPASLDDGAGAADKAAGSVNNLSGAAQAAPPPIAGVGDAAKDMAAKTQAAGQQAAGGFDPIAPAADAAGKGVTAGVNPPVNAIPGTVQTATGQVSFQPVLDAANQVFGQLPQTVATGVNGAVQAMTDGTNRMQQQASTAFNAIVTSAGTGMAAFSAAVQVGMNGAKNAVQTGMTAIQTAAKTGFDQLKTTVTTTMTAVQTAVKTGTDQIKTAFTTTFTAVQTADTTFWTQMKTMATTTLTAIHTLITQQLQQITQLVTQTYQQLTQLTQQTWQQLLQIVTTMGNQIVAQCRTIAQQILQVFTQLANDLYNAGNTMMQRLAAGITAGGAAAVAAAQNVAAQIKAQFPASPAKEGPLSGRGDTLISGGKIIERLADGMHRAQSYLMRTLVPIMDSTAHILSLPGVATPTTGITISDSVVPTGTNADPAPVRLLDAPSSTALNFRGDSGHSGGGSHDRGPQITPEDIAAALHGCVLRFEDDGRGGMAKVVNRQNRQLARR